MSNHQQIMQELNEKMIDTQNSFITKISNQVIQNMKDIKLLEDRLAKLEANDSFDLEELKKEVGFRGYTNE